MALNTLSSEELPAGATRIGSRRRAIRRTAAIVGAAALGAGALTAPVASAAQIPDGSANYAFQTFNNSADPTFNQLLGINANGLIAGYYGSGMKGHPNKGYLLSNDGAGPFKSENFPHSQQTQVTGLNDRGITVGFWADKGGDNFGFYESRGRFHTADYPTNNPAKPAVDQLLGVNDQGVAVGFYNDGKGNSHGYSYNIHTGRFGKVTVPGASTVSATAINNAGDIAGFDTNRSGATVGFLKLNYGKVITLSVAGASMTQPFGVNDGDTVVGTYTDGTGSSATTHAFVWTPGFGFETISDPAAMPGTTTINGINDHGRLVGFYTDASGNVKGMVATPEEG
jgi:hypothetical protein